MNCSIISIGTELNLGLITNTNSQYIAQKLSELGIECNYMFTVPDRMDNISNIVKLGIRSSDITILSGGLGPTDDDLTREAVAAALEVPVVRNKKLDPSSLKFIRTRRTPEINERLLRQSYIPEGSIPIIPLIGSASGFRIGTAGGKYVFSIPGVPKEMRSMFENDIIPFLNDLIAKSGNKSTLMKLKKATLLTTDISETEIEEKIKDLVHDAKDSGIEIGITATPGLIKIIIVEKSSSRKKGNKDLKYFENEISGRMGNFLYGKGDNIISDNLKTAIEKAGKNITISTAESVTGGLISSIITDTPGSSNFFLGGIVSYSIFSKKEILKIDKGLIEQKGVVSIEVCREMALNARSIFNSDYSIAVTGFAGPEHDKGELGLVYCCITGPGDYIKVFEKRFLGTRAEIKFRTVQFVLNELRNAILHN
ncbi:CinA family nicotinamide mononucleotide deamidase-related protein [Actinomycetota bacterium]